MSSVKTMTLRIEKAVYGGDGLGRAGGDAPSAGKTIFVPYTLPGEMVECLPVEDKRSFAKAQLFRVLEPSTQRVPPVCKYFSRCGGCQYQHARYPAQLEMKRTILAETFSRAGIPLAADAIDTLHDKDARYRNRVRLHIRFGDFALCYREAGSHHDVVVSHCPIAAPLLERILEVFPSVAESCGLEAGLFDEVEFFTNDAEDTLLLSLWTTQGNAATRALPILCEALSEPLPMLCGAVLFQSETQKGQGTQQASWGDPDLLYTVAGYRYRVHVASFFQVNRFLVSTLVEHVTAGMQGRTAWDLFAGVGLFAVPLSQHYEQVVAVEQAASSIRNLRQNLPSKQHRIVAASTIDFLKLQTAGSSRNRPDLVVVDPPRAGLGKDVTALLSQIGPQQITYISCDPATLARDVQQLLHSGYQLKHTTLIDLFPQTFHLETIVVLQRG